MCFSVANWAGISKIVSGCRKTEEMVAKNYYEGKTDIIQLNNENSKQIELVYLLDFEKESLDLVKQWEKICLANCVGEESHGVIFVNSKSVD